MDVREITWAPERMTKHLDRKQGQSYLKSMNSNKFISSKYPTELRDLVREKVTELPSDQLVVIYLTFWENLCEYEIAKEIRTTISNVLKIKSMALESLRELMAEEPEKELSIA